MAKQSNFASDHGGTPRGRPARRALYVQLDDAVAELDDRFGGLPSPRDAEAIWDELWVHEAHHSTAIEGNTLTPRQVAELLRAGRAVGDKPLGQYMEVVGYADAARWVYAQALQPAHEPTGEVLTVTEVRYLHELVMTPDWGAAPHPAADEEEGPGGFRRHDIRPFQRHDPSVTSAHPRPDAGLARRRTPDVGRQGSRLCAPGSAIRPRSCVRVSARGTYARWPPRMWGTRARWPS